MEGFGRIDDGAITHIPVHKTHDDGDKHPDAGSIQIVTRKATPIEFHSS